MNVYPQFNLSTGSLQSDRDLGALIPDNLKIDDQSLKDFMNFIVSYSSEVKFVNELNIHEGNWESFFKYEYPFILAYISSVALKEENAELQSLGADLETPEPLSKSDSNIVAQLTFEGIIKIARRIDGWYRVVIAGADETKLSRELTGAISNSLGSALVKLKYLGALTFGNQYELETGTTFKNFSSLWGLDSVSKDVRAEIKAELQVSGSLEAQTNWDGDTANYNAKLAEVLWMFIRTQSYLVISATNEFSKVTGNNWNFKPYAALLVAYWEMYSHPQKLMNGFVKKHLDFYYEKVLHLKKRGASPDQIFVSFELVKSVSEVLIPKGAALDAGKDKNGLPVLFTVDNEVSVNKNTVVNLMNLYFPRLMIDRDTGKGLISDIFAEQVIPTDLLAIKKGWAPFGATDSTNTRTTMGFALAAPVLLLQEGQRTVKIDLYLDADSGKVLDDFFVNKTIAGNLASHEQLDWLSTAFIASASGKDDWVALKKTVSAYDTATKILTVLASLTSADGAILEYKKTLPGFQFDTVQPVIRLMLNNDSAYFFYDILSQLNYTKIAVQVNVRGLNSLELKNANGEINADKPFLPFGVIPVINSDLYVGNREFEAKCINRITFNAEWSGLPPGGIRSYYKDYQPDPPSVTEHSFKTSISKPDDTYLINADKTPESGVFNLFNSDSPKGIIKYKAIQSVFAQNTTNKNRFYKVTLLAPDFDDLNERFRQSISSIMWKNAHAVPPLLPPLPRIPFSLSIKKLTVDYTASVEAAFSEPDTGTLEFFHIDVFSQYRVYPPINFDITGKPVPPFLLRLIPRYENSRYLFVALDGVILPSVLHLFFQLHLKPDINGNTESPEIFWEYLNKDRWIEFEPQSKPLDKTLQLSKSEIIRFILPVDMVNDNSIMPVGAYWIRGSIKNDDTSLICNVENMYSHAVSATRLIDPLNFEQNISPIMADSVKGLVKSLSQIKKVHQPAVSFGGNDAENTISYYRRVSERLNHKQRAVSSWDFERLLLQQFPELYFVCCLNSVNIPKPDPSVGSYRAAGHVTLVVIPSLLSNKYQVDLSAPRLPYVDLEAMTRFLKECASPAAIIHVVNPHYLFLKVTCALSFIDGTDLSESLLKLNNAIVDYLSPWKTGGNSYDIKSKLTVFHVFRFIERFPGVEFIDENTFKIDLSTEQDYGSYKPLGTVTLTKNADNSYRPWVMIASMEKHTLTIFDEIS